MLDVFKMSQLKSLWLPEILWYCSWILKVLHRVTLSLLAESDYWSSSRCSKLSREGRHERWREWTEVSLFKVRNIKKASGQDSQVPNYSLSRLSSHKMCPRETFFFQMLKEYSRAGLDRAPCLVILLIYFSLEVNGEELFASWISSGIKANGSFAVGSRAKTARVKHFQPLCFGNKAP